MLGIGRKMWPVAIWMVSLVGEGCCEGPNCLCNHSLGELGPVICEDKIGTGVPDMPEKHVIEAFSPVSFIV